MAKPWPTVARVLLALVLLALLPDGLWVVWWLWAVWPTVARVLLALLPVGLWVVWWLWAVNWNKLWPVLARGGWVPAVLLGLVLAALLGLVLAAAWSRVTPDDPNYPPLVLPPLGWQLVAVTAVTALAGLALFCGWLQGRLGWTPAEVAVEPPAAAADGHGHGPAHH